MHQSKTGVGSEMCLHKMQGGWEKGSGRKKHGPGKGGLSLVNFRERSIYEVENLEIDCLKTMHTPQKVFMYPGVHILQCQGSWASGFWDRD